MYCKLLYVPINSDVTDTSGANLATSTDYIITLCVSVLSLFGRTWSKLEKVGGESLPSLRCQTGRPVEQGSLGELCGVLAAH